MLPKKTMHLIIVGIIIGSGIMWLARAPLVRQLNAWQLLPRSERFTQLYFAIQPHPKRLPSEGGKQKMAFTVQSHERGSTDYRYKIFASSQDAKFKKLLANGTFTLTYDKSVTIHRTLSLPKFDARMAVKVELEYIGVAFGDHQPHAQHQSIHYWLEELSAIPEDREDA